jgi:hypothetical protein
MMQQQAGISWPAMIDECDMDVDMNSADGEVIVFSLVQVFKCDLKTA